ncbi:MAG: hypothetical protein ACYDBQ_03280 [Thermoplasmatota archaeon]
MALAMASEQKPAILQDTRFVVQEGWVYRFLSKGAILMNKLWLSALVLLAVWVAIAGAAGTRGCTAPTGFPAANASRDVPAVTKGVCSVFLNPTTLYLGSMVVLALILQVALGLLGNAVGRTIMEATPASAEPGAPERKP